MNFNDEILDASEIESVAPYNVHDHIAPSGKRFLNLLLDYLAVMLIFFTTAIITTLAGNDTFFDYAKNSLLDRVITVLVYVFYATIMEFFTGKTLAKFLTGTKVVDLEGNRPGFLNLLGRNFARFIPFNQLTFFSRRPVGWHDSLSNTRVVND